MTPIEKARRYLAEHGGEVEFLEREGIPFAKELRLLAQRGKEAGMLLSSLQPPPPPSQQAEEAL